MADKEDGAERLMRVQAMLDRLVNSPQRGMEQVGITIGIKGLRLGLIMRLMTMRLMVSLLRLILCQ